MSELEMYTYRDAMSGTYDNLSWCKPFISDDGTIAMAQNEGKIISVLANGVEYGPCGQPFVDFLRAYLPYFEDYSGYTENQLLGIAADVLGLKETGCADCPWNNECEAMSEPLCPAESTFDRRHCPYLDVCPLADERCANDEEEE